ncbi:MAG: cysteine--tRNA ligase [Clostridia bacterium]|nr:cysteine--tRNA ligase [Clostridia bacterium]
MALKIYNSLTKTKQEFVPIEKGHVGMYVCGPTVYGPSHVGHARTYVNFDTIRRYLMASGYAVKFVENITDVGHLVGDGDNGEDKIAKQALKENLDPYAIAYKYECMFFDCMDKLNILRPSISCRATGFIPEMIDMVQTILDKGYGYVTPAGNVYFRVRDYHKYGQLSNRKLDQAKSGERIEVADDKENPEDFALWKTAEGGHIMKWKSPWGVGYPGWHLECSVMSRKFLGDTFDIHGGGLDNIFPHHESEFAQSEVTTGKPFVHYFMHNNLVTVNGTKMGKSLGNFITLDDLFTRHSPMAVRYFILNYHYRSPLDFNETEITKAEEQLSKILETYQKIAKTNSNGAKNAQIDQIYADFVAAMDEDFNTPLAISELLKLTKLANSAIAAGENLAGYKEVFDKMFYVLGIDVNVVEDKNNDNEEKLLGLISEIRNELRAEKNYALSDKIRDSLSVLGIESKDRKI